MINVLVVDDEPIMCRGLSNAIDWEQNGFRLVGSCNNGDEALAKMEQHPIDIIITDIRMPVMSGLELSKHIHANAKEVKVIILSGYDDFNYAKESIRYGVCEYLLKPIDNSELLNVLLKVKGSIERKLQIQKKEEETQYKLTYSLPALKEKILRQMVEGKINSIEEFKSVISVADLNLRSPNFVVEAFYVCNRDLEQMPNKNIMNYAKDMIAEILNQYNIGEYWIDDINRICVLFSIDERNYETAVDIGESILYHVNKFLEVKITGSISMQYRGFNEISFAYKEAIKALKYKILLEGNHLLKVDVHVGQTTDPEREVTDFENDLLFHLRYGDKEKARQSIDSIYTVLKKNSCSPEYIEDKTRELVVLIIRIMKEFSIDLSPKLNFNIYNDFICNFNCLDEIIYWLQTIIDDIADNVIAVNKKKYGGIVGKVLSLIEQEYRENITLNTMAEKVYMNSNYLSQLFKQQTGKNFLEYLTEYRIERAKELLRTTNIKAYDIAEEIGYKDQHYFSQVFKKTTGFTPSEYRKKVI